MKLQYKRIHTLPPLAWLAYVNNGAATVLCGSSVECTDDFFVDGAWNGDFANGDFAKSDWFCGTGGRLTDYGIVFSTPSHVTSGLFAASLNEGMLVSNSLHFLCAYADYHFDPQYLNYEIDFNTVLFGIEKSKKEIYTLGKDGLPVDVRVYYYRNIEIDDENRVNISVKPKSAPFTVFADYYDRLCGAIGGMIRNAQDNRRSVWYEPVTTISRGYDAPCCAAIAKKFDCDTAVTFAPIGKYAEDCGVDVAKALGYSHIVERDANAYLQNTKLIEAEAVASGELGTDFQFSVFDDVFHNKLVFIGERGDKVWARKFDSCNDEYAFADFITGIGASERRLWVGYISVPMPLYGAGTWTSIQKLSQSEEMEPWTLHNRYDRPIPRRICEEAGVARELFGMEKHGAGISLRYDWGGRARSRMSETAAKSFSDYVRRHKKAHPAQMLSFFWKAKGIYLGRLGLHLPGEKSVLEKSQIANATEARYLFPWASEVIGDRYKKAIFDE